MRNAVFAGSFDPFTNGHLDVIKKAALLFDNVYVMLGVNIGKKRFTDAEAMIRAINSTLENSGLSNCKAYIYDGLLVDFAAEHDARYIVRGLRDAKDFEYEESMAVVNMMLMPNTEYVYLRANRSFISSSMVRELRSYNRDISAYVPADVLAVTEGKEI